MPVFRYEALDATGQARSGQVEADDVAQAAVTLSAQALVVLSIELVTPTEPVAPAFSGSSSPESRGYLQRVDAVLSKPDELIKLLESLAAEPGSSDLRLQLNYLIKKLRSGVNAAQFLNDERLCTWLPIVMSSERTSHLETRYSQWLTQVMNERARRRGLMAAFSYPVILMLAIGLVIVALSVFIIPTFQKMYAEFGLALPTPTRFLFAVANTINYRWPYLLVGLALVIAAIAVGRSQWRSRAITTHMFGWIFAGNNISLVAMSRLTSVLAEMLELGAPVSEAFLVAGRACRHAYYRQASQRLAAHLSEPSFRLQASPVAHNFPQALLHALSAGENQRPSVSLIRELARIYSDRLSARASRGAAIASPIVVAGLGMMVAFVVVSLFMPMVQMITSLS